MSNLKVLIVGASIAGPTAAYWFARAGAQVTVIERFPQLRTAGQGIDIRSVGITVMRKMTGMEAAVKARCMHMDGISFVRSDGKAFATMHASKDSKSQTLVSEFEILRGDLAQVLYDLTKKDDKIKYVFGEQVASMAQTGNGPIAVHFANNKLPTAEYDLVVACDGATSRTRAMGLECGVRDHIKSTNSWAAYFTIEENLLKGSRLSQLYSAPGGRFLALGPDPDGATRAGLMGIGSSQVDATQAFREAQKEGTEALKNYMIRYFAGSGWRSEEIMAAMMEADDFYASEIVQVKVPSLYKGRFVMVGDAGYSPCNFSGAGTSLAMAGGYLLAGEIFKHQGDIPAGLQAYEERMAPMIKDFQKLAPGVPAIIAPQTAMGIQLRDMFLIVFAWITALGKHFAWIGGLFASSLGEDKYGIPEYDWSNGK